MSALRNLVFVGQGPNQTAWLHGLAAGRELRPTAPEDFAEDYCARVAVTGAVGTRLAALLGLPDVGRFRHSFHRRNLNTRWNGKHGRGDKFDHAEGVVMAGILADMSEFTHFVLLGASVADCFGFVIGERGWPWCSLAPAGPSVHAGKRFLLFPHPSGLNHWWNDADNHIRARTALNDFVNLAKK
jgi:hypothetical protein